MTSKLLLFVVLISLSFSCKESGPKPSASPIDTVIIDQVSPEEAAIGDTVPSIDLDLHKSVLDNGMSVYDFLEKYNSRSLTEPLPGTREGDIELPNTAEVQKELFIAKMTSNGKKLSNKTIQWPNTSQKGIGYGLGLKDYRFLLTPTSGDCRSTPIHGLDCSGLIYWMSILSNVPEMKKRDYFNVASIMKVEMWNQAFSNSADYAALEIKDIGDQSSVPLTNFKNGDLICWYKKNPGREPSAHVGFVVATGSGFGIINSRGGGQSPCERYYSDPMYGPITMPNTKGWVNAYASGNYRVLRISTSKQCGEINDVEGNTYSTVNIGGQCWMAENLRSKKYQDGTSIGSELSASDWSRASAGAFVKPNASDDLAARYGYLYNGFTAQKNPCPIGWKIPSNDDWSRLVAHCQTLSSDIGLLLRKPGFWRGQIQIGGGPDDNSPPPNAIGFSALPAGRVFGNGFYGDESKYATFLSSSFSTSGTSIKLRSLSYNGSILESEDNNLAVGASCRCIKE